MITLKIDGMTCNHCVRAVTQAVQSIEPAANVEIDLDAGTAKVATGKELNVQPIIAAIQEEGYAVKSAQSA